MLQDMVRVRVSLKWVDHDPAIDVRVSCNRQSDMENAHGLQSSYQQKQHKALNESSGP